MGFESDLDRDLKLIHAFITFIIKFYQCHIHISKWCIMTFTEFFTELTVCFRLIEILLKVMTVDVSVKQYIISITHLCNKSKSHKIVFLSTTSWIYKRLFYPLQGGSMRLFFVSHFIKYSELRIHPQLQ